MNQDIKARWVADLRSGVHEQTTDGALALTPPELGDCTPEDAVKFCCLGRLCELVVPMSQRRVIRDDGGYHGKKIGYHGRKIGYYGNQGVFLPQAVVDQVGLDDENPNLLRKVIAHYQMFEERDEWGHPTYIGEDGRRYELPNPGDYSLSELNDGGFTFPQIADVIEWGA